MSSLLDSISNSSTMQMASHVAKLRSEGEDIIDLTVGEPDFDTPSQIKQAAQEALSKNYTHYTSARGILPLRQEIADFLKRQKNIPATPEEILITPGAKQALFYCFAGLLEPGDEVLVPEPAWVSYGPMIMLNRGRPIPVPSTEEEGFLPPIERIRNRITEKTRAIVVCTPSNPTGAVCSKEYAMGLLELCGERGIYLISDEVYSDILYDGKEHFSFASPGKSEVVLIGGVSKMAAMTGWRIGYVKAEKKIIDSCLKMQQQTATCPSSISQYAAIPAFRQYEEYMPGMLNEYKKRRDILFGGINEIEKLSCRKPEGSFYLFVNIKRLGMDSVSAAYRLIETAKVAAVPGSAFGESGEGYLRFSFAASENQLYEAITRLKSAIRNDL